MIYKTLVIDDEPAIRKDILFLLSGMPEFEVRGNCGSIAEAKKMIELQRPDLVLLDIQLIDGNAFDLLQSLDEIFFKVIFITAYSDKALKAIKFGALDYLLKPLDEKEFKEALNKMKGTVPSLNNNPLQWKIANEHLENTTKLNNRIVLRTLEYLQIVQYDDIVYCKGDAGYTTFYLSNNKKITTSKSMKEYEDLLPAVVFIRTHQSYIVNINFIERYHKEGYLVLKDNTEIPVATRRKESILRLLSE